MKPEELIQMSLIKQTILAQLQTLVQLAQMSPDSLGLAALLHAVSGVALIGKEEMMCETIRPMMKEIIEEAVSLLKEVMENPVVKEAVESARASAPAPTEDANFFDDNEIIH